MPDKLRWMPYLTYAFLAVLVFIALVMLAGCATSDRIPYWAGVANVTGDVIGREPAPPRRVVYK